MGAVQAREKMATPERSPPESEDDSTVTLEKISAQVTNVYVDTVDRTKEDIILRKIKPIFKAQHFGDLILKAQDARSDLQGLY